MRNFLITLLTALLISQPAVAQSPVIWNGAYGKDLTSGGLIDRDGYPYARMEGRTNYIKNPSAKVNTSLWAASGTLSFSRTTSSLAPRQITTATAFSVSSNSNGAYLYSRFELDKADYNRKLSWTFDFNYNQTDSAVWCVSVHQASSSGGSYTEIPLSTDDTSGDSCLPINAITSYTTTFDTDSANPFIEIRYRHVGTNDNQLYLSNVYVGPGSVVQGAIVTPWQSFTPTGNLTTNVTYTGWWRRVGEDAEIYFKVAFTGTNTQGNVYFNIPSIIGSIDYSRIPTGSGVLRSVPVGTFEFDDASAGAYSGLVYAYGTGQNIVYPQLIMSDTTNPTFNNSITPSSNRPATVASGDTIMATVKVPIAEWAGSGTVNLVQNDAAEYVSHDGTNIVYGPAGAAIPTSTPASVGEDLNITSGFRSVSITDTFVLEIQIGGVGPFLPASAQIEKLQYDGTNFIGADVISASAAIYMSRGKYRRQTGSTSATWATLTAGSRWRVKKVSGGQPVGFSKATETSLGLVKAGQVPATTTGVAADVDTVGYEYSTTWGNSSITSVADTPITVATISNVPPGDYHLYVDASVNIVRTSGSPLAELQVYDGANVVARALSQATASIVNSMTIARPIRITATTTFTLRVVSNVASAVGTAQVYGSDANISGTLRAPGVFILKRAR